MSSFFDTRHYY